MWDKTRLWKTKRGQQWYLLYFLLGRNCRRQCRNRAPAPRINLHPCSPMHLLHLPSSYRSKWTGTMWQLTGSLGIASVSVKHAMYDEERSDRGPPCLLITVPEACVPASHPIIVSSTDILFSSLSLWFAKSSFLFLPRCESWRPVGWKLQESWQLQSRCSFICPTIPQMEKKISCIARGISCFNMYI